MLNSTTYVTGVGYPFLTVCNNHLRKNRRDFFLDLPLRLLDSLAERLTSSSIPIEGLTLVSEGAPRRLTLGGAPLD